MPYWSNGQSALYHADAREIPLPDGFVHCVVTSPPYFGLRDYGLGQWAGGAPDCEHEGTPLYSEGGSEKQRSNVGAGTGDCVKCGAEQVQAGIGLEATFAEHVENILAVFRELRRVLRDDGIAWLNYGDAYANDGKWGGRTGGKHANGLHGQVSGLGREKVQTGLKPKDLIGMPWRLAFALQDDGWYLRSAPVWVKPNPMPESVRDRPSSAYEMVFMLTKSPRYFYDIDAVRMKNGPRGRREDAQPSGANLRNVWEFPTQSRPEAHFATFPDELPRRCVLLSTSEHGVCAECGAQWVRQVETTPEYSKNTPKTLAAHHARGGHGQPSGTVGKAGSSRVDAMRETLGWSPSCGCGAGVEPAVVLDPFVGSGTTAAVAQSLGRRGLGLDLNPEYLDLAVRRLSAVPLSLF